MTLVVDASVATKWVLEEDGSDRAAALRGLAEDLVAPSLIAAEIGNAVWKRATSKQISPHDAVRALQAAIGPFTRLIPSTELAARSMEIAIALRHPIYDCFYLALAERERCPFVTADQRFLAVAKRMKGIELRRM
jgi:predicted nucleic acid-binding protein